MIPLSEDLSRILRSLWNFISELPYAITYDRRSVHNLSIIRSIGTILPLAPAPRVVFNLAAWNPELKRFTGDNGVEILSPKIQPHDSSNYQRQIDDLQDELKAIKDKLAVLLERETCVKLERLAASKNELTVKNDKCKVVAPPPPPPPPPMPDLTIVTSKPPYVKRMKRTGPRYGPPQTNNSDALHLVLSQLANEKPKLRHVERSPGGRPIRQKREPEVDTNDVLAQVLKKRYSAIQESSDAESFNASFTDISSPIKSSIC